MVSHVLGPEHAGEARIFAYGTLNLRVKTDPQTLRQHGPEAGMNFWHRGPSRGLSNHTGQAITVNSCWMLLARRATRTSARARALLLEIG